MSHDRGNGGGSAGGDGHRIDFETVSDIARRADDLGNQIVELATYAADASASAKENHPGWALAGAVGYVQEINEFNIQGFGRASCDMGDRLNAAIQAYKSNDNNVADELKGIGN